MSRGRRANLPRRRSANLDASRDVFPALTLGCVCVASHATHGGHSRVIVREVKLNRRFRFQNRSNMASPRSLTQHGGRARPLITAPPPPNSLHLHHTFPGYAASFSSRPTIAATRTQTLDPVANAQIARLSNGFTLMEWLRFHDLSPFVMQPTIQINLARDGNFFQPFAGLAIPYQFGESYVLPTVATLPNASASEWHHYAITWDAASRTRRHYIDGVPLGPSDTTSARYDGTWLQDRPSLLMGLNCYQTSTLTANAYASCNPLHQLDAEIDDVALFAGAMSEAEVALRWNASITNRVAANAEPNLILFYNFNDPISTPGEIANLGLAGAEYDLILGRLPKPAGYEEFGRRHTVGRELLTKYDFVPPQIVPYPTSLTPPPREHDLGAAEVISASAASTVTLPGTITPSTYTTPSVFNDTTIVITGGVDSSGNSRPIHIQPRLPPGVLTDADLLESNGPEDTALWIKLPGTTALGLPLTCRITRLPLKGSLEDVAGVGYQGTLINMAGHVLVGGAGGAKYVKYFPHVDTFGTDTFSYTMSIDSLGLTSEEVTSSVEIEADNDLPQVIDRVTTIEEDSSPFGIVIDLIANDAEYGTPLELVVATLPTRGYLYQCPSCNSSHTNATLFTKEFADVLKGPRIADAYSIFDQGTGIFEQYLSSVLAVSSFWGNAPNSGYHALNIVGPPDCSTDLGECAPTATTAGYEWIADQTVYPNIGQRLRHNTLTAFVTSTSPSTNEVTIEYTQMYNRNSNGQWQQCIINPQGATLRHPEDCSFDLTGNGTYVNGTYINGTYIRTYDVNPETGRLRATVPRTAIEPITFGAWSPLQQGYVGNTTMVGGGAFGPQYEFDHRQYPHYTTTAATPPYTEYIEVAIAKAVYPFRVEIGQPRGMGCVVAVKVLDPDGNWIALYAGAAKADVAAKYERIKRYWQWAAPTCRSHFKASIFRLELDTSPMTGIADWNYIDYVKIHGSQQIQTAALPYGMRHLIYVPHKHASGTDSFQYAATDCPGDLFRSRSQLLPQYI